MKTKSSITRPSNTRSTMTVASEALMLMPSLRLSTYERMISPARAG
jgi:hypothetical protein